MSAKNARAALDAASRIAATQRIYVRDMTAWAEEFYEWLESKSDEKEEEQL